MSETIPAEAVQSPFVEDQYAEALQRVRELPEAANMALKFSLYRIAPGSMQWQPIESGPAAGFNPFGIGERSGPGRYVVQIRIDGRKGNRGQVEFEVTDTPRPQAPALQMAPAAPAPAPAPAPRPFDIDAVERMSRMNVELIGVMAAQAGAQATRAAEQQSPVAQLSQVVEFFKAARELDPKRQAERGSTLADVLGAAKGIAEVFKPSLDKLIDRLNQPRAAVRVVNAPAETIAAATQATSNDTTMSTTAASVEAPPVAGIDQSELIKTMLVALGVGARNDGSAESYAELVGDSLTAAGALEQMLATSPGELAAMVIGLNPSFEQYRGWLLEVENEMREIYADQSVVGTIGNNTPTRPGA